MKAKKKRAWLEMRKKWFESQPQSYQNANTKPGSVKVR